MMGGGEMGGGMWHWEGGASAKQALNSCIVICDAVSCGYLLCF